MPDIKLRWIIVIILISCLIGSIFGFFILSSNDNCIPKLIWEAQNNSFQDKLEIQERNCNAEKIILEGKISSQKEEYEKTIADLKKQLSDLNDSYKFILAEKETLKYRNKNLEGNNTQCNKDLNSCILSRNICNQELFSLKNSTKTDAQKLAIYYTTIYYVSPIVFIITMTLNLSLKIQSSKYKKYLDGLAIITAVISFSIFIMNIINYFK